MISNYKQLKIEEQFAKIDEFVNFLCGDFIHSIENRTELWLRIQKAYTNEKLLCQHYLVYDCIEKVLKEKFEDIKERYGNESE